MSVIRALRGLVLGPLGLQGSRRAAPLAWSQATQALRGVTTTTAETDAEKAIAAKLVKSLAGVQSVTVQDTSGGCGAMYNIIVVADAFKGKKTLEQQKLVYQVLEEDIAKWHGLTLSTKAG